MTPEDFCKKWSVFNQGAMMKDLNAVISERVAIAVIDRHKLTVEQCAQVAENGNFLHDAAPDARFGKSCASAIRKLASA
jgi:hypothetical protein